MMLPDGLVHGDIIDIPIDLVSPNDWNPNEMSAAQFDLLSSNIDDVGYLQPVLVAYLEEEQRWRIIDGEHRYEAQKLRDVSHLKCVVADPDMLDEAQQKFQTVRMNKIRGSMNVEKFVRLVNTMASSGDFSLEELGVNFGFDDSADFLELVEGSRESLPSVAAKAEFDRVKKEIKSVDDLADVLNHLFTKYGDTLPANFMVLDFGGREHLWIRFPSRSAFTSISEKAREVMACGYTFDSFLLGVLNDCQIDSVPQNMLQRVPANTEASISDFLSEDAPDGY